MRRTSAWLLALIYVVLIVYASLYPFIGWRTQGLSPWQVFVHSPVPRAAMFDKAVNLLGYIPFGFLLCLGVLRSHRRWPAVLLATMAGGLMSLLMETLQIYLPTRVPSLMDLALNWSGAGVGALLAWGLERLGAIARWSRFRVRWFVADARGALVLLALWPVALLFPAPVPLGLGQVLAQLELFVSSALAEPQGLSMWWPLRPEVWPPLSIGGELLAVVLGALAPCLLVSTISPARGHRLVLAALALALGFGVTLLSNTFSYGPLRAWDWLTLQVQVGWCLAWALAWMLAWARVPSWVCAVLLMVVLVLQLALLNSVSPGPYLAQTLQTWEQGRWINFYGLAQWLGWLWPYAALVHTLVWLRYHRAEN